MAPVVALRRLLVRAQGSKVCLQPHVCAVVSLVFSCPTLLQTPAGLPEHMMLSTSQSVAPDMYYILCKHAPSNILTASDDILCTVEEVTRMQKSFPETVTTYKYLGLFMSSNLSWSDHIQSACLQ